MDKMFETTVCKALDTSKQKTAIPWKQKTNEVSGITAPAMSEFLGPGTGRRNPGKAHKAPWVEEMNADSWEKPRQLEFTRQHAKEERATQGQSPETC